MPPGAAARRRRRRPGVAGSAGSRMFRAMNAGSRGTTNQLLPLLTAFVAAATPIARPAAAQEADPVAAGVRAAVADLAPGTLLPVLVEFEPLAAPPGGEADAPPGVRAIESLRERAVVALRGLEQAAAEDAAGVRVLERFWIVPAATVEVTRGGLERLAAAPGVRRIVSDAPLPVVLEPEGRSFAPPSFTSDAMRTIGADAVWEAGATGDGVVIAFFDSGVDAGNAMVSRRWRGNRTSVRASWFDPFMRSSRPRDLIGHGTQVAVAALGALAAGDTLELANGSEIVATSDVDVVTGPAPAAEWIAARVFQNFGNGVYTRRSVLLQAFEWALDPDGNPATDDAPDIINNSWGILPVSEFDLCEDVLYAAIDAAEAAGIAVLFSAGNAGPDAGSVAFPAARDDEALRNFAVGASTGTTTVGVAGYSGRGPSPCGGGIKPEIIAPGVVPEVRFDGPGRARLTGFTVQGTSYSAAQVAGALALVKQARPNVSTEQLKLFLLNNAVDLAPPGPDDAAGHGLLDVPAALGDAGGLVVAGALQVAGADVDEEGLTVRLRNRGAEPWPGGSLRVEPAASRVGGATASAELPPIGPGRTVGARLSGVGASGEGTTVRVTVSDRAGGIVLSRLVFAGPPDDFGGFVLTAGQLAAGANDFGRLGRIAATPGFSWQGTELLPAGGIGVAAGGVVSDGFYFTTLGRYDLKRFGPAADTEWAPQRPATDVEASEADVRFDDFEAVAPAGLELSVHYAASEEDGVGALGAVVIVRNRAVHPYPDLHVGLLADWDYAGGEAISWVPGIEALVTEPATAGGPVTLLAADTTVSGHVELPLGTPGIGGFYEPGSGVLADSLLDETKRELLEGGPATGLPGAGTAIDNAALLGLGPFTVLPGAAVRVRFWLVAAADVDAAAARLEELRAEQPPPPPGRDEAFAALPPYPNPFRPAYGIVRFPYTLPDAAIDEGGGVGLEIYDLAGRRIYRERQVFAPGATPPELTWDGRLGGGDPVASGAYMFVIRREDETVSGRLLVVR